MTTTITKTNQLLSKYKKEKTLNNAIDFYIHLMLTYDTISPGKLDWIRFFRHPHVSLFCSYHNKKCGMCPIELNSPRGSGFFIGAEPCLFGDIANAERIKDVTMLKRCFVELTTLFNKIYNKTFTVSGQQSFFKYSKERSLRSNPGETIEKILRVKK